jgi:hypothetical protein
MDNIGDWLYIILLVIAALSGLLRARKKKTELPEETGQPEMYGDWPPVPQETAPPQPPSRPTVRMLAAAIAAEEGRRAIVAAETTAISLGEISDENAFQLPAGAFEDIVELKKAIIYAEILNRKY